jgi:hypothetical protein
MIAIVLDAHIFLILGVLGVVDGSSVLEMTPYSLPEWHLGRLCQWESHRWIIML